MQEKWTLILWWYEEKFLFITIEIYKNGRGANVDATVLMKKKISITRGKGENSLLY